MGAGSTSTAKLNFYEKGFKGLGFMPFILDNRNTQSRRIYALFLYGRWGRVRIDREREREKERKKDKGLVFKYMRKEKEEMCMLFL